MARTCLISLFVALALGLHPRAQAPGPSAPAEFDVASMKRNMLGAAGGSRAQTLAGGSTIVLTNVPLADALAQARPDGVMRGNIVNIPGWMNAEYYDITVKGPAGSTPEHMRAMWQTLLAQRMKLVAHVENREATVFNLVLANGKWGPALKKSTLDCAGSAPPASPSTAPAGRCGFGLTPTSIVSGGATMDVLARVQLTPLVGAPVTNRTGLDGYYAFTLTFATPHPAPAAAPDDNLPDLFTALREQLGLKLESAKTTVPYWIVDHVERPSED